MRREKTKDILAEAIEGKLPGYRVKLVLAAIGFYRTHASCNECRWEANLKEVGGIGASVWSDYTMTECLKRDFDIIPNNDYSHHTFYAEPKSIKCPNEDCSGNLYVTSSQNTDWYGEVVYYRCKECREKFVRQGQSIAEAV